jgi:hypothetical protein
MSRPEICVFSTTARGITTETRRTLRRQNTAMTADAQPLNLAMRRYRTPSTLPVLGAAGEIRAKDITTEITARAIRPQPKMQPQRRNEPRITRMTRIRKRGGESDGLTAEEIEPRITAPPVGRQPKRNRSWRRVEVIEPQRRHKGHRREKKMRPKAPCPVELSLSVLSVRSVVSSILWAAWMKSFVGKERPRVSHFFSVSFLCALGALCGSASSRLSSCPSRVHLGCGQIARAVIAVVQSPCRGTECRCRLVVGRTGRAGLSVSPW